MNLNNSAGAVKKKHICTTGGQKQQYMAKLYSLKVNFQQSTGYVISLTFIRSTGAHDTCKILLMI